MTVEQLGVHTNRGLLISAEASLDEIRKEFESGGSLEGIKKTLFIALDDQDGKYEIAWRQSGLRMSEMLSLLEVAKTTVLAEMGYLGE